MKNKNYYHIYLENMADFDFCKYSLSIYTGKKNAEYIIQQWIYESYKTTISAVNYVKEKTFSFENTKRRLYMFSGIEVKSDLGFIKPIKIFTV